MSKFYTKEPIESHPSSVPATIDQSSNLSSPPADVDLFHRKIKKLVVSMIKYFDGDELLNWDSCTIDVKNIKNINPSEHKGIGLIIFQRQGETQFICSGGHNERLYLAKIQQEVSFSAKDNRKIFSTRLEENGIEQPTPFIRSCECIVFTPHEETSSAEMEDIKHALCITTKVKYPLKGNRQKIIIEYMKKMGWM